MNPDTLAQDKLADAEYIRTLDERRREHLRCAALCATAITHLRDMRDLYERDGSYVAPSIVIYERVTRRAAPEKHEALGGEWMEK